jgi:hypothetical protein
MNMVVRKHRKSKVDLSRFSIEIDFKIKITAVDKTILLINYLPLGQMESGDKKCGRGPGTEAINSLKQFRARRPGRT